MWLTVRRLLVIGCHNRIVMSDQPAACPREQELNEDVQRHLRRIAELAHAEREALQDRHTNLWVKLDKEIELEIGEKERSIGALNQHRKEHGC
jgi:hypothetical protein